MEQKPYIVYIKTDAQNRILAVDSSAFLLNTEGWIAIDSGFSDKHHHAQCHYFPKQLHDGRGIPRYKTVALPVTGLQVYCTYLHNDVFCGIYARTTEEMNADWVEPGPDTFELDMLAEHEYRLCCLELGI